MCISVPSLAGEATHSHLTQWERDKKYFHFNSRSKAKALKKLRREPEYTTKLGLSQPHWHHDNRLLSCSCFSAEVICTNSEEYFSTLCLWGCFIISKPQMWRAQITVWHLLQYVAWIHYYWTFCPCCTQHFINCSCFISPFYITEMFRIQINKAARYTFTYWISCN